MSKTISLAVVARNFEYLTITLDSIVRQSYKPIVITVIHDPSDDNIAGIIRHYKQLIRSLDIHAKASFDTYKTFGDRHCLLESGDILAPDCIKEVMKSDKALFIARGVTLDTEGGFVTRPDVFKNTYALLAQDFIAHRRTLGAYIYKKGLEYPINPSNIQASSQATVGIRQGNKPVDTYNPADTILRAKPQTILHALTEYFDGDRHAAAQTFAKIVKMRSRRGHVVSGMRLLLSSGVSPGYRKPIVKAFVKPDKTEE